MSSGFNYTKRVVKGHPSADRDGHVLEHILVAEKALGKYLPDGAVVHHADENTKNNANGNLVICQDVAYHKLLHVRIKTLRRGGDPNTEKFCADCETCKPFEAFNVNRANLSTGLQAVCRDCQHVRWQARKSA